MLEMEGLLVFFEQGAGVGKESSSLKSLDICELSFGLDRCAVEVEVRDSESTSRQRFSPPGAPFV
jgi:hypothetical protein